MPEDGSMSELPAAYGTLRERLREAATLGSAAAVLGWDQETYMPPAGAELRGAQLAALSAIVHERRTSAEIGELIAACEADAALMAGPEGANLRALRHDFDRATRLPTDLVRRFAEVTSRSMHAWRDARERSDFASFAPWLKQVVELNREKADALGAPAGGEAYDALLEDFEPGMTAAAIAGTFTALRGGLVPLIQGIRDSGAQPDDAWQRTPVPVDRQVALNRRVMEHMGFDFEAGRLDVSTHPFCEGMGPGDVRITTRYREDAWADALSATLHETGHALYEQNLPKAERFGQPLGEAVSMGVHESQSRMWENLVGRSREFWSWMLPVAREVLGSELGGVTADGAFRGNNRVEPHLIRIESDEATYNLHIMLRFDLERAMLRGELAVDDLPGAWNERVRADLGLEVPDDRRGCLQDIHWSMGAIGYFPTYTLGNLYAAQYWEAIQREIPDLGTRIAAGDFAPLTAWLIANVHAHGRRFSPPELCERISGRMPEHEPLMVYLRGKYGEVYGI
jgi:carboxypeptidase Taq